MFPCFAFLSLELVFHTQSSIIPLHLHEIFILCSTEIKLTFILARKCFFKWSCQGFYWALLIQRVGTIWLVRVTLCKTNPFESVYHFLNFQRYAKNAVFKSAWWISHLLINIQKVIIEYFCYIINISGNYIYHCIWTHVYVCIYVHI